RLVLFASGLIWCALAPVARADEPSKNGSSQEEKKFELPIPRVVASPDMPYYLPSSLPQPGTREIWQYYGVDNRGRWVARVILSPGGSYYYYNGQPFPWTSTQPQLVMPYVVD